MITVLLLIVSTICFSIFNALLKTMPNKLNMAYLLPFITLGIIIPAVISLFLPKIFHYDHVQFTKSGALLAVGMGLSWGIGQIFGLNLFYKVPSLTVITPISIGCIALIGALIGVFIFKESFNLFKFFGIASIILGAFLLSRG